MIAFNRIILLVLLILFFISCSDDNAVKPSTVSVIRIGLVPDRDKEEICNLNQPLINYLSKETGLKCEIVIPDTYTDLLEAFLNKQIDIAYFGGYTFTCANKEADAVPLVFRNQDPNFKSYYIVNTDVKADSLNDLKGIKFSFGPPLSTSGNLMPRYFMKERGIVPDEFFSEIVYSKGHDNTVSLVRDKVVDAGVVNYHVYDDMIESGELAIDDVRILEVTPPFADYVWAMRSDYSSGFAEKFISAFLKLSIDNPEHAIILEAQKAQIYFPASEYDYKKLSEVIDELGLAGEVY